MFDFLKKLMGKGEPEKPAPAAAPQKSPLTEKPAAAAPQAPAKPAPAPSPAPAAGKPSPAPAPAAAPPAPAASVPVENVELLLSTIIAKLSQELQGKVHKKPGSKDSVKVPVRRLAEQLQQGSVKIPLGDLVKACPPTTFQGIDASDSTMIDLPLAEILKKISPTLLTRRANQKKVEVPADVVGLFGPAGGKGGKNAPVSGAPVEHQQAAPAPAPAAAPAPAPAPVAAPPPPPPAPAPVAEEPAPAPAPPPPAPEPAAPIQISSSLRDLMSAASASAAATPTPALKPTGTAPTAPATQKLPASTPPPAAPSAPKPATTEGMITVALTAVSGGWPDAVKLEAAALGNAQLELPVKIVADTLRQGKLIYQWRQIKGWLKPAAGAPSANDDTAVELPMQVITPLFLAARPAAPKVQKKVAIDETIPSMFAQRAPSAPAPSTAPAGTPIAPAKPASDLGTLFGQAEKSSWAPKEIVQKASALPGMAGAIIALQDGLVVESHLPPTLKAETVAGFLPQIFSRLNQYTKEMQIGELNGLIMYVDHVPWQIFKAGTVYFAALGRVGEALPSAQLTVIATELGRQNNK